MERRRYSGKASYGSGRTAGGPDRRDEIGAERKGRLKAAVIARRVAQEAIAQHDAEEDDLLQVHSDRGSVFRFPWTDQLAWTGDLATASLLLEVETWPKPGLVSHVDCGSHDDMHAGTFRASVREVLHPFFVALASAGGTGIGELRAIGLSAKQAMMAATGGVNTHRGAIFGLGLLCAAAGALQEAGQACRPGSLGTFVRLRWGSAILSRVDHVEKPWLGSSAPPRGRRRAR